MKALILLSGGVDSATCLGLAVQKYGAAEVFALSVYYGQTHSKELDAAQKVADFYGVDLKRIDLSVIFEGSDCSLLADSSKDIPLQSYAEQLSVTGGKPVSTYVPFRNGLFLSAAASVALRKVAKLYITVRTATMPQAMPIRLQRKFNSAMGEAIYTGSGGQLKILAPFVNLNKSQVVKRDLNSAFRINIPGAVIRAVRKPCGVCATLPRPRRGI